VDFFFVGREILSSTTTAAESETSEDEAIWRTSLVLARLMPINVA
jgi:hypothetical protein